MHLTQRPCHQRGSLCQDLASNRTTQRPPDQNKEMQTAVVWTSLPFIRSGQTILQGIAKGWKRQGRQKRWDDNIREWTGFEFVKSQMAVENREKWRKLVIKSSVVPQRPSRLRDRWWWWTRIWIPILNVKNMNNKVPWYYIGICICKEIVCCTVRFLVFFLFLFETQ